MYSPKKNRKKTILFILTLLFCNISLAQNKLDKLSNIKMLRQLEDIFNNSFSSSKTGCSISQNGDVIEWDSVICVRVSYNLADINLEEAVIAEVPQSSNTAIYVSCNKNEKCIMIYHTATKKTRFYRDAEIFVLPSENKTNLILILDRLKTIQHAFKNKN